MAPHASHGSSEISSVKSRKAAIVRVILSMLKEGSYAEKIAARLNLASSTIHDYIQKLQELGYIEREVTNVRSWPIFYKVTAKGSDFLRAIATKKLARFHHFALRFVVEKDNPLFCPVEEGKGLRGVAQGFCTFEHDGRTYSVRRQVGADGHSWITVYAPSVWVYDAWEGVAKASIRCYQAANAICNRYGIDLENITVEKAPHIAFPRDPFAELWGQEIEISVKSNVGMIDGSEKDPKTQKNVWETEFTDLQAADLYLRLPEILVRLAGEIRRGRDESRSQYKELLARLSSRDSQERSAIDLDTADKELVEVVPTTSPYAGLFHSWLFPYRRPSFRRIERHPTVTQFREYKVQKCENCEARLESETEQFTGLCIDCLYSRRCYSCGRKFRVERWDDKADLCIDCESENENGDDRPISV